jgi:hypothetical protein
MKNKSLSQISETDSNKYQTIDSQGQTIKRNISVPEEERKLTGKGVYNIDEYEYDHDYYSDDFESDEESEESSSSSIMMSGSSGSTVDKNAQRLAKAAVTQANKDQELERVVEAYNMILENTVTDEDFEQYRPMLNSSLGLSRPEPARHREAE